MCSKKVALAHMLSGKFVRPLSKDPRVVLWYNNGYGKFMFCRPFEENTKTSYIDINSINSETFEVFDDFDGAAFS